ncbi:MAG: hypothetical protein AAGC60_23120 [Acidobacteriota bacterium]
MAKTPGNAPSLELDSVVDALAADVASDYRIEPAEARTLLRPLVERDTKLRKALTKAPDLVGLQRMRAYRDARKKARKEVYYILRQYKRATPSGDDLPTLTEALRGAEDADAVESAARALLEAHSSTRERLSGRASFDRQLLAALGAPRSILDVGGGVYPLMFPFSALAASSPKKLERYVALDRDAAVTDAVAAYAAAHTAAHPDSDLATTLEAYRWDLRDGWSAMEAPPGGFDVALLLKVVPVVARQEPALLDVLASTPARRLVVSGSRVALAKKTDIEHRERTLLRRWAEAHDFRPIGDEILVDEEFALVLEPPAVHHASTT